MKRIAVFCGSSSGNSKEYIEIAFALGNHLAINEIGLVYGGAKIGLMGAVADGVLAKGGEVIGVLPKFLAGKEIAHEGLTELILVETMHERKMKMHELCDGIITLPGGFGTMEELFEVLTWAQLGLHKKPIGLLNISRFYDSLLDCIDTMVKNGFLKKVNQEMLISDIAIADLLKKMSNYIPPQTIKWINNETT